VGRKATGRRLFREERIDHDHRGLSYDTVITVVFDEKKGAGRLLLLQLVSTPV
jgi:hypothetical protein